MAGFIGHAVGFYFESAIMIVFFILLFYLYRLYRISRNKLALLLVLANLFYFFNMIVSWFAKIISYLNGPLALSDPLQYITRFKLNMVFIIIGSGFLLLFHKGLFKESPDETYKRKLIIRKLIEGTLIIVLFIPVIITQSETIALVGDALGFFIVLIDSLFIIPYSVKSRKKAREDETLKKFYINISLMGYFLFNVTTFLLLDRVSMIMGGFLATIEGRYSVFYYCTFITFLISVYFSFRAFSIKIENKDEGIIDPQDFLSLFKRPEKITVEEVTYYREQRLCLVCKGDIGETKYLCDCGALYCTKCTFALIQIENMCWACQNSLDKTKQVDHVLPEKDEHQNKKKKKV